MKDLLPKIITDLVVKSLLKLAGLRAWLASIVIKQLVKLGVKIGTNIVRTVEDNKTIKEGEALELEPVTEEVKKKRKENFEDLIKGRKP